ncbi:MAG: hypothetical protein LUQ37_10015 [Methanoregulaceae archaeon]|nr:hypothetical protein [Methanoregulaceae archaeon]
MTEITHTPQCLKQQEAFSKFVAEHPGYCHKCGGSGMISYPSTRYDPGGEDPCSCLESGHCPMCGKDIETDPESYVSTCPVCHWTDASYFETGLVDWQTCPDVDCYCWETEWKGEIDQPEDAHLESLYESRTETDFYVYGE